MKVIVIGGGIIGAATARSLARRGIATTVLERGRNVGGTSSAGEGNLLLSDKGPGDELRLTQYSSTLWPRVDAELADELGPGFPSVEFERKGGVVVATTAEGAQPLLDFAAAQRSAGVIAHAVQPNDARCLEPHLNPDITAAVHYPEDAQVQPVIMTEALIASAMLSGAQFSENEAVLAGIRNPQGALVGVTTTKRALYADAVIVASGPWSGEVAALLGVNLPVRPRRGMVLVTSRMPHRILHKVYDADYVGAVGSGEAALQTSSVVETTAAGTVLIGSSRQQVGFDSRLDVAVLRELAQKALRLFPFLAGIPVMRSYGGFRPFMPDHLPVIGPDPRLPGLWHATGHEGAGIGLSVATGALLADLLTGVAPAIDVLPFSPSRASLAPHLEQLVA
ncbi:NAD(P)/FAD-dependent oxidoreductase [Subtercola boreus]|uniref:FAD-dependent oxidoreductase n=1 Tax=Subtercola boreus TaxID=120213 RepID=A0A3E0W8T8_9MICO|nr:FAD-dependent oxidoreductase [Subtercola boreus]RFA19837.1 FAD-dependent oxidoreductase [Subtercola boreus]RFA19904.1 FAD-dependent oxidoreductase [Subtercola boreus]RFA26297.1 FAD-dependent oxidoreductase [Subtercola boreus]